VVDVRRQRIGDAPVEGSHHRFPDGLETVLQVERGQRGLEQRCEDVAVARQPVELVRGRELRPTRRQALAEPQLARDDGTARARNDVRADLRHPALGGVGIALVQRPRDRQLEHAVAEELQPLVRRGAIGRPGAMRENGLQKLVR